jgi:hypothetical protein
MICPNCGEEIDDKLISKHLAGKGGRASSRTLSSEDAKKMAAQRGKGDKKKPPK